MVDGLAAMGRILKQSVQDGYRTQLIRRSGATASSTGRWRNCRPSAGSHGACCSPSAPVRWPTRSPIRTRCRRLDLPGGDGRAQPPSPARHRPRADDRDDHRPDWTVLLGPEGHRHAPRDVRRVAAGRREDRGTRLGADRAAADLRRLPRAARSARPRAGRSACPSDGRMVVVSGGGWGVGDIEGAVAQLAPTTRRSARSSASRAATRSFASGSTPPSRASDRDHRLRLHGPDARDSRGRRRARPLDRRRHLPRGDVRRGPRSSPTGCRSATPG